MNWKTLLACCALATLPLGCDSSEEGGDDHGHETEGHDTDGHGHETEGHETEGHETEGHDTEDDSHGHDTDGGHNEEELITTVTLTFTAEGQDPITVSFDDPDGPGGASGTADDIALAADTTYAVEVGFFNALENEDISTEIAAEAEEHQILVYGDSVTGPASMGDSLLTHAYDDVESDYTENTVGDDLPVGLANTITTGAAGSGELHVMLRHLPPLNDEPQKTADLASMFAAGESVAGGVDADVHFDVTVE